MSQQEQNQIENQNDIEKEIARLKALQELRQQQQQHTQQSPEPEKIVDDVRKLINDTGKYARLPVNDGDKRVFQFFNDKTKRRIVERVFTDPTTGKSRAPQKRIQYDIIVPETADQGEKLLDVPKSLALQIEDNIDAGHYLLEITRRGTGVTTRYTAIAC